ncbi:MAG TPA: cytochrome C oxidase subunit IV family protein [Bauldia sp.]|nr:cytochrome C oxidase subunit IV family protein [Bauldia sp.]
MTETRSAIVTWVGLLVLLAITAASSRFDLGWGNVTINLAVAVAKALLILVVFMRLKANAIVLRLAAAATILWIGIMYVLVFADYASR